MYRALDGDLTAEEQADLETYFEGHPDARSDYDRLRKAAHALAHTPLVEPPADIKGVVMDRIVRSRRPVPRKAGIFDALIGVFRARPAWRYACAFSGGLLCGIIILAITVQFPESSSSLRPEEVSGTITRPVTGEMAVIDEIAFTYESFEGKIIARTDREVILLTIDIRSPGEVRVDLSFAESDLSPAAIWQSEPFGGIISANSSSIVMSLRGDTSFEVVLRDLTSGASRITCRVSCGDQEHVEEILTGSGIE